MPRCAAVLPKADAFHSVDRDVPLIARMIEQGLTGRKGKGGFYRLDRSGGGRAEAGDRPEHRRVPAANRRRRCPRSRRRRPDLRVLLLGARQDRRLRVPRAGADHRLCRDVGAARRPTTIADIDEAMRLGYNWKWGPFELVDKLGSAWLVEQLTAQGMAVPQAAGGRGRQDVLPRGGRQAAVSRRSTAPTMTSVRAPGVLLLEDIKLRSKAGAEERVRRAVGYRRRRRVFRVHRPSRNALDDKIIELLGQVDRSRRARNSRRW